MAKRPYRRVTAYHFRVEGEEIAITQIGQDYVCVEEVSKNGQEDTHMAGVLVMTTDGQFVWEEGEEMFARYTDQSVADGIREYLNKHGLPGRRIA